MVESSTKPDKSDAPEKLDAELIVGLGAPNTHIPKLAAALAKVQSALRPVKRESQNPYFNSTYADLAAVWESVRKPLADNALALIQLPMPTDGMTVRLLTVLVHESGEYVASEIVMKPRDGTPQSVGSCLTYARRYALCAILGVTSEDEDDDGNAAQPKNATPQRKANPGPAGKQATSPAPAGSGSAAAVEALTKLVADMGIPAETQAKWLEHFGVKSLADLTHDQADAIIAKVKSKTTKPAKKE